MIGRGPDQFAEPLAQAGRTHVWWKGRRLAYFGGCDYFRLSSDPRIHRALRSGLASHGLNVAASRKTTGNHPLYLQVEKSTARFFGAERAALVSNGYLSNLVAAQGLRGTISHALIDDRAHASLRDAAAFLRCPVIAFRHGDYEDAARKFAKLKSKAGVALLTDGLFAQNGTLAPLRAYRQALGADVLLWVDDAHAAGVIGTRGQGSITEAGLVRHNVVQTVTFSKAFGVYGGAILSDERLFRRVVEHSSAMTGNTPLPLPLAAAVLASLQIVRSDPEIRRRLRKNITAFWRHLGAAHSIPVAPIISLAPAEPEKLRKELLSAGIYPSLIRYPGGPQESFFRFAISSEHSHGQISALAEVVGGAKL